MLGHNDDVRDGGNQSEMLFSKSQPLFELSHHEVLADMETRTYPNVYYIIFGSCVCKPFDSGGSSCNFENIDLVDWSTCIDTVGRSTITTLYVLSDTSRTLAHR